MRRLEELVIGRPSTFASIVGALRERGYGRYIQWGKDEGDLRAPRRTVPAAMEADEITPEVARALLALPRTVGVHPQTGKAILAGIGRYGAPIRKPACVASARLLSGARVRHRSARESTGIVWS